MTTLTPERLRAAAAVLSELGAERYPNDSTQWCKSLFSSDRLHGRADLLEHERAAAEAHDDLVERVADGLLLASDDTIPWVRLNGIAEAFLEQFDVTPKAG